MTAPLVWVATELGRTHLFTGFPWVLLGYSQSEVLPIVQLASLFGVYGISALVAGVSAARAAAPPAARPADRWRPVALMAALILGTATWGSWRAARAEWTGAGEPIRVGLVQGNVNQAEKWDVARAASIFNEYLDMTHQAIGEGASSVVWPSRLPRSSSRKMAPMRTACARLPGRRTSRSSSAAIRSCAEPGSSITTPPFSSATTGRPPGCIERCTSCPSANMSRAAVLFCRPPAVEAVSDFSPGLQPVLLPLDGHLISTAICYEVVFPHLVRRFAAGGPSSS